MGTQLGVSTPSVEKAKLTPIGEGRVHHALTCPVPAVVDGLPPVPDRDWPVERWLKILDRIDHRQFHVGLRYWGPPIWLEVTMTGPDADLWPANTDHTLSWDWQSSTTCAQVEDLLAQGADDDSLVAAVGRYTIENLILNAVHEIGEWLRFDGQRLFPAHIPGLRTGDPDGQGNGAVAVQVTFENAVEPPGAAVVEPTLDELAGQRLVQRLARTAVASRFTYLPGTTMSYEASGPVIRTVAQELVTTWRSSWSRATVQASGVNSEEMMALAARDIHHALVSHEADRICRALHIDGERPWRLADPRTALNREPADTEAPGRDVLSVSIQYANAPSNIAWCMLDQQEDAVFTPFAVASVLKGGQL